MTPMTATALLDLVGAGLDVATVGPLASRPLVAVQLDDDAGLPAVSRLTARLPCVVAGVGTGDAESTDLDVVVDPADLDELAAQVDANPMASLALVQLLRAGEA